MLKEPNTLFDDMTKKLLDHPQLKEMLQNIVSGMLQMPLVMQKFYEYYEEIYSEKDQKFKQEG